MEDVGGVFDRKVVRRVTPESMSAAQHSLDLALRLGSSAESVTLTEMRSRESRVPMFAVPMSRLFAIERGTNTTSSWLRPAAPVPFGESTAILLVAALSTRPTFSADSAPRRAVANVSRQHASAQIYSKRRTKKNHSRK